VTVIVLTNCPTGLRGFLTRWLLEISPGVFLGSPSARVRDVLWDEIRTYSGQGRALLAYTTDNEQGFTFAPTTTPGTPPTTRASPSSTARHPLRPAPRRMVPQPLAARRGRGGAMPQSAGSSAGECRMAGGREGAPDTGLGDGSPRQARCRLLSPTLWRVLAGMLRMTLIRLRTGAAYSAPLLSKVSKNRCRPR
jgi:CRISPR-associated protein Cas2